MKKLLAISLITLISACGGEQTKNEEERNVLENLEISVDSLVVDPAGEIFMPAMLFTESQSSDGKYSSFMSRNFNFSRFHWKRLNYSIGIDLRGKGQTALKAGWIISKC